MDSLADEFKSSELSSADRKEIYEEFRRVALILKVLEYKNKKFKKARESAPKGKNPNKEEKFKYTFKEKELKWFKNLNGQTLFSDNYSEEEKRGYKQISSEMAWAQIDSRFKVTFSEMMNYVESSKRKKFFDMCQNDIYLARDLVGMVQVMKHLQLNDVVRAKAAIIYFGLENRMSEFDDFFIYKISESTKDEIKQILQEAKDQGLSKFELKDAAEENLNKTTAFINRGKASFKSAVTGKKVSAFDIAVNEETGKVFESAEKADFNKNIGLKKFLGGNYKLSKNEASRFTYEVVDTARSAYDKLKSGGKTLIEKCEEISNKWGSGAGLSKNISMDLYIEYSSEVVDTISKLVEEKVGGLDVSDDAKRHKEVQITRDVHLADDLAIVKRLNELYEENKKLTELFESLPVGEERTKVAEKKKLLNREIVALYRLKYGKYLVGEKDDPRLHYSSQIKLITRKELTARIDVNLRTIEDLRVSGGNENLIQELEEENKKMQQRLDSIVITEEEERYAETHKGCSVDEYKDPDGDRFAESKTKKKCLERLLKLKRNELKKLQTNKEENKEKIVKLEAEIKDCEEKIADFDNYLIKEGKDLRKAAERDKKSTERKQYDEINKLFENVKKEENYHIIESIFEDIDEIFERHIQDVSLLIEGYVDASVWSKDDVEKVKITWMLKKLDEFEEGIDTYSENPLVRNKFNATISEYRRKLENKLNKLDKVVIKRPPKTKDEVKLDHIRTIQEFKGYPVRTKIVNGEEHSDISKEQASKAIRKVTNAIIGLCGMKVEFDEIQTQMCEEAIINAETYLEKHKNDNNLVEYDSLCNMLQNAKKAFEKAKEKILSNKTAVHETAEPESSVEEEPTPTMGVAGDVSESKLVEEANSFTIVLVGGASKKSPEQQMDTIIHSK